MCRVWSAAGLLTLFALTFVGATEARAGSGNAQCTGPAEALVFSGARALVIDEVSAITPHHCWTMAVPANSFAWAYAEPLTGGALLQLRLLTRNPVAAFPPPAEIEAHTAQIPVIPARPFATASTLYVQVSRQVVTTHYRLHVFITSADVARLDAVSDRLRPAPSAGIPPDLLMPLHIFGHAETSAATLQHGLRLRAGETISLLADGRPASLTTRVRPATGIKVRLEVYAPDGSFVVRPPVSDDRVAGTFTASTTGLYRLDVLLLSASNGPVRLLAARSGLPPGAAVSDLSLELTTSTPQFDGGQTTHVYRVRNLGAATVSGAEVQMPLFASILDARGSVGASSLACNSAGARGLRCALPSLPANGTVDITVVHDPAERFSLAQSLLPVIELAPSGTTYDSRLENDAAVVTVLPWVAARPTAQVTSALPGASVALTIAAVNEAPPAGVSHQTAAVIEHPLGTVPGPLPSPCLQETLRLRCLLTVPGSGPPPSLTLPFHVAAGLPAGTALPFTVTLTSEHPDVTLPPDRSPGNDVTTATATVLTAPSVSDTDGDSLSNLYEQAWGLDPANPDGEHGPHGDPDGDGRTNAQELADGTHPRGTTQLYFAEGSTGAFFDQRLALFNTGTAAARVLVRYLRPAPASPVTQSLALPGLTRSTIDLEAVPGLENTAVSAVVESDQPVVADRTMSWDTRGYGAHAETAVPAPRTTWYFAEGSTAGAFNLFYLLQNPGPIAAHVQVRYLRPAPHATVTRSYTVEPNSRLDVWVNKEGAELASTDVSAVVESSAPIIAERAMYLDGGGLGFRAGHDAVGIATPATEWLLAEGATGPFFDLFVLLANPNATDAQAEVTFLLPDGRELVRTRTIPANSRTNIWVDLEAPELADTAVSTTVRSTNGVPLLVERAMWWPGNGSTWYEAHASAGVTSAATRWALAEGETGGPRAIATYVLIGNTASVDQDVRVTLYPEGGAPVEKVFRANARSRFNVDVAAHFPELGTARFGTVVAATLPASIIVERAMYWDAAGAQWDAGTNAVATPLP